MTTRGAVGITTRRFDQRFTATEAAVNRDEIPVAPGPGAVGVWAASTQADGLLTCRLGSQIQLNRQLIPEVGATLPINTEEEAPLASKQVAGGERITVDYVEVTAATARILILWVGQDLGIG